MTFGEVETKARAFSRVSVSGASQAHVFDIINDSVTAFGRDVYGFPYRKFLTVAALFDVETNFYFKLTIVGSTNNDISEAIAVSDSSLQDQTGTEIATLLQAQIRAAIGGGADLTVAWANFAFTIDAIDSTSIAIEEITATTTQIDYTKELFGGEVSATATSLDGGFPKNCTTRVPIGATVLDNLTVVWDSQYYLREAPLESFSYLTEHGTPDRQGVRGQLMYIYPNPDTLKKLEVNFKGVPEPVAAPETTTVISTAIPDRYHLALVYWVASELMDETHEFNEANKYRTKYFSMKSMYLAEYANKVTENKVQYVRPLWYDVIS